MNYKNIKISEDALIAKQSVIVGDVTVGRDSCVLYYAVIRGDEAPVTIGGAHVCPQDTSRSRMPSTACKI